MLLVGNIATTSVKEMTKEKYVYIWWTFVKKFLKTLLMLLL